MNPVDLHHCQTTQPVSRCCGAARCLYELQLAETPLAFTICDRDSQSEMKEHPNVGKDGETTSPQSIHHFLGDLRAHAASTSSPTSGIL